MSDASTILLVDDEEALRVAARRMLQRAGFTVIQASDGADALRVLAEHTGPVHVLVTDVVMPNMSGPDLVDRMLPSRPGIRVLFLSGYSPEMIRGRGLPEGSAFLQKPFDAVALVRKIRALIVQPAETRI